MNGCYFMFEWDYVESYDLEKKEFTTSPCRNDAIVISSLKKAEDIAELFNFELHLC